MTFRMNMQPNKKKTAFTESLISLVIFIVLIATGTLIWKVQADFDVSKMGIVSDANLVASSSAEAIFDFGAVIESGWSLLGVPQHYSEATLYEKINGKAPLYLDAGFKSLIAQRIVNDSNDSFWFEIYIYDMAKGLNAFSVYSQQKRSGAESLKGIESSYKTENSVFLTAGKYYIEIIGSLPDETLNDTQVKIAGKMVGMLSGGASSETEDFGVFPPENLDRQSITVIKADAFGYQGFTDIFVADYKLQGQQIKVFVRKNVDKGAAEKLADEYGRFLSEFGFTKIKAEGLPDEISVFEYDGIFEIVFAVDIYTAGIHEAYEKQSALKLALEIYKKLGNFE